MKFIDKLTALYLTPLVWFFYLGFRVQDILLGDDLVRSQRPRSLKKKTWAVVMAPLMVAYVGAPILILHVVVADQYKNPVIFSGILMFNFVTIYALIRHKHLKGLLKSPIIKN